MKLVAATGNGNKLCEFARILNPLGVEVLSPRDVGIETFAVDETGGTFAENAALKARAMFRLSGIPSIGDDSGLCVDALGGRPGIYSSRFMHGFSQAKKNLAIIKELESIEEINRTARFICNIYCIISNDEIITAEGVCEGKIARVPSGKGGFGYDPIFLYGDKSFASLSGEEKDMISHRGIALKKLAARLKEYLCTGDKQ